MAIVNTTIIIMIVIIIIGVVIVPVRMDVITNRWLINGIISLRYLCHTCDVTHTHTGIKRLCTHIHAHAEVKVCVSHKQADRQTGICIYIYIYLIN